MPISKEPSYEKEDLKKRICKLERQHTKQSKAQPQISAGPTLKHVVFTGLTTLEIGIMLGNHIMVNGGSEVSRAQEHQPQVTQKFYDEIVTEV